jgi:hypothetical protein
MWQQGSWYSCWRKDISWIRQNEARSVRAVDDTHKALFKRTFLHARELGFAFFLLLVKHGYIEEYSGRLRRYCTGSVFHVLYFLCSSRGLLH